ncbi:MAG: helix-turn-helix transcriptional regulator, partial [Porticoccaceae bacterium]|nr:helix-turn-helix transcriptional regulator [Porticoccaceae bacterium]
IMDFSMMTDLAVAAELGKRIDQLRLERNLTQQQLADAVGLSRVSYAKLVAGQAKFTNVIAVLRALDQLALLENFVPEQVFSPMEQLKMKGKRRLRATGSRGAGSKELSSKSSKDDKPDELDW